MPSGTGTGQKGGGKARAESPAPPPPSGPPPPDAPAGMVIPQRRMAAQLTAAAAAEAAGVAATRTPVTPKVSIVYQPYPAVGYHWLRQEQAMPEAEIAFFESPEGAALGNPFNYIKVGTEPGVTMYHYQ